MILEVQMLSRWVVAGFPLPKSQLFFRVKLSQYSPLTQ